MTGIAIRRGLRLGVAVAGLAALGVAAPASAQQAPAEVAAVEVLCIDLGYDISDCTEAVSDALAVEVVVITEGLLLDQGIAFDIDLDI